MYGRRAASKARWHRGPAAGADGGSMAGPVRCIAHGSSRRHATRGPCPSRRRAAPANQTGSQVHPQPTAQDTEAKPRRRVPTASEALSSRPVVGHLDRVHFPRDILHARRRPRPRRRCCCGPPASRAHGRHPRGRLPPVGRRIPPPPAATAHVLSSAALAPTSALDSYCFRSPGSPGLLD